MVQHSLKKSQDTSPMWVKISCLMNDQNNFLLSLVQGRGIQKNLSVIQQYRN